MCDRDCLKHIIGLQHSISWIRGDRGAGGSGQELLSGVRVCRKASWGLNQGTEGVRSFSSQFLLHSCLSNSYISNVVLCSYICTHLSYLSIHPSLYLSRGIILFGVILPKMLRPFTKIKYSTIISLHTTHQIYITKFP